MKCSECDRIASSTQECKKCKKPTCYLHGKLCHNCTLLFHITCAHPCPICGRLSCDRCSKKECRCKTDGIY